MTQLTAEVALELESLNLNHIIPQHVPGLLNVLADKLSRPHAEPIPSELSQCVACRCPKRTQAFYRTWPERLVGD